MKSAAVVYVKDLRRMGSFYRKCFRMDTADDADDHCVLESEPLTSSFVRAPDQIATTIVLTVPSARRENVAIHCDGIDPEGNVIQLVQPVPKTHG